MESYNIPSNLLQAIVSLLGTMPAVQSRGVLNAIEQTCTEQDEERKKAEIEKIRKEAVDAAGADHTV